jgi:hypothetical protein
LASGLLSLFFFGGGVGGLIFFGRVPFRVLSSEVQFCPWTPILHAFLHVLAKAHVKARKKARQYMLKHAKGIHKHAQCMFMHVDMHMHSLCVLLHAFSMVLNVFVPNSTEKPEIGKRAKVTVVTEWIFWPYTRYRKMYLKIYSEKCVSVSSTVPLEKWMIEMIERKFHHNLLENVVKDIYEPIYYRSLKVNGKYDEVIKDNWYKDEETLRKLLMSVRKK